MPTLIKFRNHYRLHYIIISAYNLSYFEKHFIKTCFNAILVFLLIIRPLFANSVFTWLYNDFTSDWDLIRFNLRSTFNTRLRCFKTWQTISNLLLPAHSIRGMFVSATVLAVNEEQLSNFRSAAIVVPVWLSPSGVSGGLSLPVKHVLASACDATAETVSLFVRVGGGGGVPHYI